MSLSEISGVKGWLCIASDGDTTRVGDVFDEALGETYAWPKSIPHASSMSVGDVIAIWNRKRLLGVSWIESIVEATETREQFRCPNPKCLRLDMRRRRQMIPQFKCGKCSHETDNPIIEQIESEVYIARYAAGWSPVERLVDADECRSLTENPRTQHSIRAINIERFGEFLSKLPPLSVKPFESRLAGHVKATVRVRVGQGEFRQKMRTQYRDVCAFTGENHPAVLEAAHLYSYAAYGEHHEDGGLLLRRDVHRLFDKGLLAVNPKNLLIDAHPELLNFEQYKHLHGEPLKVKVKPAVVYWLNLHWGEFRPA